MGTGFGQKCVGVKQINKILSLPLLIKRSGRPKGKARMNNLETQTKFGTHKTRPRQEKQNLSFIFVIVYGRLSRREAVQCLFSNRLFISVLLLEIQL
jgi:hypothetical protein